MATLRRQHLNPNPEVAAQVSAIARSRLPGQPVPNWRVPSEDVDRYLAALPEPQRSTLRQLRATIVSIVPDAEEGMAYGSPAYKVGGKAIAGFAAFTNHLSYLPHS